MRCKNWFFSAAAICGFCLTAGCGESVAEVEERRVQAELDLIAEALHSGHREHRLDAIKAVAQLDEAGGPFVPDLVALLDDKDRELKAAAIEALGDLGPVAVEALDDLDAVRRDRQFAPAIDRAMQRINADDANTEVAQ